MLRSLAAVQHPDSTRGLEDGVLVEMRVPLQLFLF